MSKNTHPCRVQLSRRKGWRIPKNSVVVSRPSKWGNPFTLIKTPEDPTGRIEATAAFRILCKRGNSVERIRRELRGKNLACWCPLDGLPCHADVLLEIANT